MSESPLEMSMLSKYNKHDGISYFDHYETDVDGIPNNVNVDQLAKAFFLSPAFTPERLLLSKLAPNKHNISREELNQVEEFKVGNNVAIFNVIEKSDSEILFKSDPDTLTWLAVEREKDDKMKLHFGSAILKPNIVSRIFTPFHKFYSRYLLGFAKEQLVQQTRESK